METNKEDKVATDAGDAPETTMPVVSADSSSSQELFPLNDVLNNFLSDISAIQKTYRIVLPHVLDWLKKQHDSNLSKLKKQAISDTGSELTFETQSAHEAAKIMSTIRDLDDLGGIKIPETLQRSLFTQIFSEYDSFIGGLLREIYKGKDDLLKGISRQLTFADLLAYESLNAVKLDMLDKEVDSFRRESYVEQFSGLEAKFGIKLKSFPEWGDFIELSQRRNLIVHNGGMVSEQYLLVCEREGFVFNPRPSIGERLDITPKYFSRAIVLVSKVAFMLTHTLWRKIFPAQKKKAHGAANSTIYELLKSKRWNAAREVACFSMTPPMRSDIDEIDLRIRTINCAIALKFSKDENACIETLGSLDWSASYRDFKLALAVLKNDYANAANIMRAIGKNGELIDEFAYHEWPLFHEFREKSEFLEAYKEIYGISFVDEAIRQSAESPQLKPLISKQELESERVSEAVILPRRRPRQANVGKSAAAKSGEN